MTEKRHPIQPLVTDEHGRLRFKSNAIVRHLLDNGPFDMNTIAMLDVPQEDREQFVQLTGYSLSGFSELSYVTMDTYETAEAMANDTDERESRIATLQATLDAVRTSLKDLVPAVFRIHPDDLEE